MVYGKMVNIYKFTSLPRNLHEPKASDFKPDKTCAASESLS